MEKLEHIGIAVKNLQKSNELFEKLLGKPPYKTEVVEREGVRTSFFDVGGIKIELIEAIHANSPIANSWKHGVKDFITWRLQLIRLTTV